jgi:hypothetical protein
MIRMTRRASSRASEGSDSRLGTELVGGPTAILEYGGLTKLSGPALDIAEQDPIDVALLSHHHHTAYLTLSADHAADVAQIPGADVLPQGDGVVAGGCGV